MKKFSIHNIVAIKPINLYDVEIRYGDGKKPVLIKGTTTSQVLREIERQKSDTDSS